MNRAFSPLVRRFAMLKTVNDRQDRDGLNSLTYKLLSIEERPLYTRINIDLNQTDVMNATPKPLPPFPFQKADNT